MLDVLICGAGPVGSFFANLMDQFGHDYRIIDSETPEARHGQSRALLLTARSLEIMEDRGLSGELLSHAVIPRGLRLHSDSKQITELEMKDVDSLYGHITVIPQWRIEDTLQHRLTKKVERPVKLISYVQESDHVVAKLQHGDNEDNVEEVKARFLVGSDGVHSTVRKGTPGWTFDGVVFNVPFVLADVTFTGDKLPDIRYGNFINTKHGVLMMLPLLDRAGEKLITRVVLNVDPTGSPDGKNDLTSLDKNEAVSQGIQKDQSITLEQLQEMIDQRSGAFKMKAENPQWLAKFRVNERKANGFRRGRCFIVGDAAHCHSPAGGQGMNLGLQDAYSLAWKISFVLNNAAKNPEELLDSYYDERTPYIDATIEASGKVVRNMVTPSMTADFLRSYVLPLALNIPSLHNKFGHIVQQLYVTIPSTSKVLAKKSASAIIEPGQYMKESGTLIPKDTMSRSPQTIKSILRKSDQYIALLVWNQAGDDDASESFWNLLKSYKKFVRPVVVLSKNNIFRYRIPEYARDNVYAQDGFWCDNKGELAHALGIEHDHAGIILIRPDMYIAFSESYDGKKEIPLRSFESYLFSQLNPEQ
ncbi:FAD binding domain-containing protein [Umbelopsis sp. AD052]|nr:FAD binding domain-containing protein [Umbelopsis sp. AD052]